MVGLVGGLRGVSLQPLAETKSVAQWVGSGCNMWAYTCGHVLSHSTAVIMYIVYLNSCSET